MSKEVGEEEEEEEEEESLFKADSGTGGCVMADATAVDIEINPQRRRLSRSQTL